MLSPICRLWIDGSGSGAVQPELAWSAAVRHALSWRSSTPVKVRPEHDSSGRTLFTIGEALAACGGDAGTAERLCTVPVSVRLAHRDGHTGAPRNPRGYWVSGHSTTGRKG